jgi:hypothetical protein
MNRRQRRARARGNNFYERYVRHLPQVPLDAPLERGRVYHVTFFHDERCQIYETNNPADCNCNPTVERRIEPRRS